MARAASESGEKAVTMPWLPARLSRALLLAPGILFFLSVWYVQADLPRPVVHNASVIDSGGRRVDTPTVRREKAQIPSTWTPHQLDSLYKASLLMADSTVDTTGRHIYTEQWQAFRYGSHFAMRDTFYVITGGGNWGDTCIYTVIAPGVTRLVPDTLMIFNRCRGTSAGCIGYIGEEDYLYRSLCDSVRIIDGYGVRVRWDRTPEAEPIGSRTSIVIELEDTVCVTSTHAVYKPRWVNSTTYPDSTSNRWMNLDYYQNTVVRARPIGRPYRVIGFAWSVWVNGSSTVAGGYVGLNLAAGHLSQNQSLSASWVTNPSTRAATGRTRLSFWRSDIDQGLQPSTYTHIAQAEIEDGGLSWAAIGANQVLLTITVYYTVTRFL